MGNYPVLESKARTPVRAFHTVQREHRGFVSWPFSSRSPSYCFRCYSPLSLWSLAVVLSVGVTKALRKD